jgi:hypothetical protein
MTNPRPTTALATTTSEGQSADLEETTIGADVTSLIFDVSFNELRHEIEDSDASERARTRARAALRAAFVGSPVERVIAQLAPSAREITLARQHPASMRSLAEARAHAVAMMLESGISTTRGRVGMVLGMRLLALGEAALDNDPKTAAYIIGAATAAMDRAREADQAIVARQRDEASRREWEQRAQLSTTITVTDAEPLAVDVDVSELDTPVDPIEHARELHAQLLARKVQAGVFAHNALDDEIKIRRSSPTPPPEAAAKLAILERARVGATQAPVHIRKPMTAAELRARGLSVPDHLADGSNPLWEAEVQRQEREREARRADLERDLRGATRQRTRPKE